MQGYADLTRRLVSLAGEPALRLANPISADLAEILESFADMSTSMSSKCR